VTSTSRRPSPGFPLGPKLLAGGTTLALGGAADTVGLTEGLGAVHTEQASGGVPERPSFGPGEGVGTGVPVPEGLGTGGTEESVLAGGGVTVEPTAGVVVEGIPLSTVPVGVLVGVGLTDAGPSVAVVMGRGETAGVLVGTGVASVVVAGGEVTGVLVGTGVPSAGLDVGRGETAGLLVGTGVPSVGVIVGREAAGLLVCTGGGGAAVEGSTGTDGLAVGKTVGTGLVGVDDTPEGVAEGSPEEIVIVNPVLSKVDVTGSLDLEPSPGVSLVVSLVITIVDSLILVTGSGSGSRFS